MLNRFIINAGIAVALGALLAFGSLSSNQMLAQEQAPTAANKSRDRRVSDSEVPAPSPTPVVPRQDNPQDSDEVVRVETNLTSIFFTAADSNKRFVTNLRKEDIRIMEDGQPQEIFTFQQNTDLPLSIAILIDTSRSEDELCRMKN